MKKYIKENTQLFILRPMKNLILQGDCLEVMKDIPDKSIDMILCDLPYGTTACKWDTIIPFEPLWEQYKRIIKDNGAIVLTASQPFTSALVMSNIKMFKYEWVWDKILHSNPLISKKQPLNAHENIVVFYKSQCTYNPQMETGEIIKRGGIQNGKSETKGDAIIIRGKDSTEIRYPKRIIKFSNANKTNIEHPTQKPVALFEYFIKTYTNEGDLVLDNCAGSGTTGVACKNLNRNFILIEKEPEYIKIIEERLKNTQNILL